MSLEERSHIERETRGQGENIKWYRARKGRITASIAKSCCGKGNPAVQIKRILTIGKPGHYASPHIKYGLENEENAVRKFQKKINEDGFVCTIRKCGLFIEVPSGILAATPGRIASIDGEEVVIEVKCLSASRELTPLAAVATRSKDSNFGFKLDGTQIVVKKKHKFYYQIQMQMALTRILQCYVVIFTSDKYNVEIVQVNFEQQFWNDTREQLIDFHCKYVIPALVQERFHNL